MCSGCGPRPHCQRGGRESILALRLRCRGVGQLGALGQCPRLGDLFVASASVRLPASRIVPAPHLHSLCTLSAASDLSLSWPIRLQVESYSVSRWLSTRAEIACQIRSTLCVVKSAQQARTTASLEHTVNFCPAAQLVLGLPAFRICRICGRLLQKGDELRAGECICRLKGLVHNLA